MCKSLTKTSEVGDVKRKERGPRKKKEASKPAEKRFPDDYTFDEDDKKNGVDKMSLVDAFEYYRSVADIRKAQIIEANKMLKETTASLRDFSKFLAEWRELEDVSRKEA